MPDTTTGRMSQISKGIWEEGFYTAAMSVDAITVERDSLLQENAKLADALRWAKWQSIFEQQ